MLQRHSVYSLGYALYFREPGSPFNHWLGWGPRGEPDHAPSSNMVWSTVNMEVQPHWVNNQRRRWLESRYLDSAWTPGTNLPPWDSTLAPLTCDFTGTRAFWLKKIRYLPSSKDENVSKYCRMWPHWCIFSLDYNVHLEGNERTIDVFRAWNSAFHTCDITWLAFGLGL